MKNELSIREKELMTQMTDIEQEIQNGRTVYDTLKRQRIELNHEKQMNETNDIEVIQPAKKHMIQLANQGEVLSKQIHDGQEHIRRTKQSFENELTTYQTSLNDLSNQVIQKNTHIKGQVDNIQLLEQEREEFASTCTNEMNQHDDLTRHFQEATKVQEDIIKKLLEQRQRTKMELKDARECEVEREMVKMEMLERGVEVMEATKRLEKVLEEKIVKMQKKIDG